MALIIEIQHSIRWWLHDTIIEIRCYLGYHEYYPTLILKCYGFEHHMRCFHCGSETWFDEYEFQEYLRGK